MRSSFFLALVIFFPFMTWANQGAAPQAQQLREQLQAQRAQVNSACSADAAAAGCPGQEVGDGLLKCLRSYKKQNKKEFILSEGCKNAMKSLRDARKEKKGL